VLLGLPTMLGAPLPPCTQPGVGPSHWKCGRSPLQVLEEGSEVGCIIHCFKATDAGTDALEVLVSLDLHGAQNPGWVGLECVASCPKTLVAIDDER
jgi:hypothetical protein